MKRHGRIVQCGMISSYHAMDSGVTFKNYFEVISNRLSILGFIVIDALPKAQEVCVISERSGTRSDLCSILESWWAG